MNISWTDAFKPTFRWRPKWTRGHSRHWRWVMLYWGRRTYVLRFHR